MSPDPRDFKSCVVRLSDGQRIHTLQGGRGQPLVFVHGLPGQGSDFLPLARRLATRYRCILIDRAGYGGSPLLDATRPVTLDRATMDLVELITQLELDEVVLVGWSYGGHVVMQAAAVAPARVHSLVLLGSAGPAFQWPASVIDRLLFRSTLGPRLLALVTRWAPGMLRSELNAAVGQDVSDDFFEDFLLALGRPGVIDCWLREGAGWQPATMQPETIPQPCLILHGNRDRRVPPAIARELADRITNRAHVELPDAAHWPFVTHSEQVEAELEAFLQGLAS